jgi:glycosyltransferase involved in cell wall biosynthesis
MKVLMSAYACEPGRGSEPGVGWNMARELANYYQVWVLTSFTHRAAIEAELAQSPVANLRFIYLDPLGWTYDWTNEGKKVHWSIHLHYYLWQVWAFFVAKSHHAQIQFDLAHHVTYVKYSGPSFLALLPIPFIWGPLGGGESAPLAFWIEFGLRGWLYESLRAIARWMGESDPFVRLTGARSHLTWATTEETAIRLRRMGAQNVQLLSQLALQPAEMSELAELARPTDTPLQDEPSQNQPLRFVSVGRLLHWKGFHLGLRAFAAALLQEEALQRAEFWIIGEGPERQRLQKLVESLDITSRVKFCGQLSRSGTLKQMALCSALVHPSLHESGGLVCLEAMAAGMPVLCLNIGGPALQVTSDTGFKVSSQSPQLTVKELKNAMINIAQNPPAAREMGRLAQRRVQDCYSWSNKGQDIAQAYLEVCNTHPSTLSFYDSLPLDSTTDTRSQQH